MKTKFFKGLTVLLSVALLSVSSEFTMLAQAAGNYWASGNVTTAQETTKVYEGEGYKAKYTLFSSWNAGSNFQIELENTGNTKIENWSLLVEYQDEINNIWNAQITSHENGVYTIKNDGWNQDVLVGQTVSFGMSASSAFTAVPASITLLDNYRSVVTDGVIVDYSINNNWGNGCTGSIDISNLTDKTIEDWTVEFDCANSEINFWDGILISHDGNHYEVHNAGYNSAIAPGQSVSVGFLVNGTIGNELFQNLQLTEDSDESQTTIDPGEDPYKDYVDDPFEDIGANYFKQPTKDDIVFDEESGLQYVKNQLLVSAYMGTPKAAIEEMVEEVGADIVGYTEITCDYQIEFRQDMTLDDLDAMAEYLMGFPYVYDVFLNTVSGMGISFEPNDGFYNDKKKCVDETDYSPTNYAVEIHTIKLKKDTKEAWDTLNPAGDNWNLEELHVPAAWDFAKDSGSVKVGIIDNYFRDVYYGGRTELHFDDIIQNYGSFSNTNYVLTHGDHVAGIIGARHNNGVGISGIATNAKLYGYSWKDVDEATSMAEMRSGLSQLVSNHCKVINMSIQCPDSAKVYAASHGQLKAQNALRTDASIMASLIKKLTASGYDFLIVASAGNYNDDFFIQDNNDPYGYHAYDSNVDNGSYAVSGGVLAEYGSFINAISDTEVNKRIIVVGSYNSSGTVSSFSNGGSRVNVLAPGEDILSTSPDNMDYSMVAGSAITQFEFMDGTSMAAPHIAGIAALMYQVNPSISAKFVKDAICSDRNAQKSINGINVPNASLCVEAATKNLSDTAQDQSWPTGILKGSIRDANGNQINDVYNQSASKVSFHVQAIRNSTGDYNLDRYAFTFDATEDGEIYYPLPQGIYDILIYTSGGSTQFLPTTYDGVEIEPDETTTLQMTKLSSWTANANGSIKGAVHDALTGNSLANVTVRIRKGWDATTGAYVTNVSGRQAKMAITRSDGTFTLAAPIGAYTVEIQLDGYVTAYYNVLSTPGSTISDGYQEHMSLTPVLPDNEYRVVLTWGDTPSDLDSHLFYYVNEVAQFHVYYWDKTAYVNGELVAKLDLDDVTSYGPETVTITFADELLKNGELHYCVHNYSGGADRLAASNAAVRLYKGNDLVDTYHVRQDKNALVWHVFKITQNGEIKEVGMYDDNIK